MRRNGCPTPASFAGVGFFFVLIVGESKEQKLPVKASEFEGVAEMRGVFVFTDN